VPNFVTVATFVYSVHYLNVQFCKRVYDMLSCTHVHTNIPRAQLPRRSGLCRYLQRIGSNRENVISFESPVVDVFGHGAPQLSVVRLGVHTVLTYLSLLSLHASSIKASVVIYQWHI